MISKLAPQKCFQKNTQIVEAWKPTKDMKFRLDFFSTELFLPENDFKTYLRKFQKMIEKQKFTVFRALFLFEVYILTKMIFDREKLFLECY